MKYQMSRVFKFYGLISRGEEKILMPLLNLCFHVTFSSIIESSPKSRVNIFSRRESCLFLSDFYAVTAAEYVHCM